MSLFRSQRNCRSTAFGTTATLLSILMVTMDVSAHEQHDSINFTDAATMDATTTLTEVARQVENLEALVLAVHYFEEQPTSDAPTTFISMESIVEELDAMRERVTQFTARHTTTTARLSTDSIFDDSSEDAVGYCPVMPVPTDDQYQFEFVAVPLLQRIDRLTDAVERIDVRPAVPDGRVVAQLWDQIDRIDNGLSNIEKQIARNESRIAVMKTVISKYAELADTRVHVRIDFGELRDAFDNMKLDLGMLAEQNQIYTRAAHETYFATLQNGEVDQSATARGLVGKAGQNQTRINNALGTLGGLFDRIQEVESMFATDNRK